MSEDREFRYIKRRGLLEMLAGRLNVSAQQVLLDAAAIYCGQRKEEAHALINDAAHRDGADKVSILLVFALWENSIEHPFLLAAWIVLMPFFLFLLLVS